MDVEVEVILKWRYRYIDVIQVLIYGYFQPKIFKYYICYEATYISMIKI